MLAAWKVFGTYLVVCVLQDVWFLLLSVVPFGFIGPSGCKYKVGLWLLVIARLINDFTDLFVDLLLGYVYSLVFALFGLFGLDFFDIFDGWIRFRGFLNHLGFDSFDRLFDLLVFLGIFFRWIIVFWVDLLIRIVGFDKISVWVFFYKVIIGRCWIKWWKYVFMSLIKLNE